MLAIRWGLIISGGIGAGLILAFSVVGSGNFDTGSMGAGQDARAYWQAVRDYPYGLDAGVFGAYLYSPAFIETLYPVLSLPWQQFLAGWTGLLMATLLVLTGPVLFVVALPIAFFEIWGGNIHLLLALAIVLSFRWPGTWAFVLLTKVTPGVGLLWFAARKEWRQLGFALGTTLVVGAVSFAIWPELWAGWVNLLIREAGGPAAPGSIPIPLGLRLPLAAVLAVYAGHTDRRWMLPIVALMAMPVLWWGSLSVLFGCFAIERERLEEALVSGLADARLSWREHVVRRRARLVVEPEG
jgi:hypothetical protein